MEIYMSNRNNQILIGSILLDLNRWGDPKTPTYEVSDWTDRFRKAGFDGMELWEYHAHIVFGRRTREKLLSSNFPATIYNTYCDFDDPSADARQHAAEMIGLFGSAGVKFNVGKDPRPARNLFEQPARLARTGPRKPVHCSANATPAQLSKTPMTPGHSLTTWVLMAGKSSYTASSPRWTFLKRWFDLFGSKVTHAHTQLRG